MGISKGNCKNSNDIEPIQSADGIAYDYSGLPKIGTFFSIKASNVKRKTVENEKDAADKRLVNCSQTLKSEEVTQKESTSRNNFTCEDDRPCNASVKKERKEGSSCEYSKTLKNKSDSKCSVNKSGISYIPATGLNNICHETEDSSSSCPDITDSTSDSMITSRKLSGSKHEVNTQALIEHVSQAIKKEPSEINFESHKSSADKSHLLHFEDKSTSPYTTATVARTGNSDIPDSNCYSLERNNVPSSSLDRRQNITYSKEGINREPTKDPPGATIKAEPSEENSFEYLIRSLKNEVAFQRDEEKSENSNKSEHHAKSSKESTFNSLHPGRNDLVTGLSRLGKSSDCYEEGNEDPISLQPTPKFKTEALRERPKNNCEYTKASKNKSQVINDDTTEIQNISSKNAVSDCSGKERDGSISCCLSPNKESSCGNKELSGSPLNEAKLKTKSNITCLEQPPQRSSIRSDNRGVNKSSISELNTVPESRSSDSSNCTVTCSSKTSSHEVTDIIRSMSAGRNGNKRPDNESVSNINHGKPDNRPIDNQRVTDQSFSRVPAELSQKIDQINQAHSHSPSVVCVAPSINTYTCKIPCISMASNLLVTSHSLPNSDRTLPENIQPTTSSQAGHQTNVSSSKRNVQPTTSSTSGHVGHQTTCLSSKANVEPETSIKRGKQSDIQPRRTTPPVAARSPDNIGGRKSNGSHVSLSDQSLSKRRYHSTLQFHSSSQTQPEEVSSASVAQTTTANISVASTPESHYQNAVERQQSQHSSENCLPPSQAHPTLPTFASADSNTQRKTTVRSEVLCHSAHQSSSLINATGIISATKENVTTSLGNTAPASTAAHNEATLDAIFDECAEFFGDLFGNIYKATGLTDTPPAYSTNISVRPQAVITTHVQSSTTILPKSITVQPTLNTMPSDCTNSSTVGTQKQVHCQHVRPFIITSVSSSASTCTQLVNPPVFARNAIVQQQQYYQSIAQQQQYPQRIFQQQQERWRQELHIHQQQQQMHHQQRQNQEQQWQQRQQLQLQHQQQAIQQKQRLQQIESQLKLHLQQRRQRQQLEKLEKQRQRELLLKLLQPSYMSSHNHNTHSPGEGIQTSFVQQSIIDNPSVDRHPVISNLVPVSTRYELSGRQNPGVHHTRPVFSGNQPMNRLTHQCPLENENTTRNTLNKRYNPSQCWVAPSVHQNLSMPTASNLRLQNPSGTSVACSRMQNVLRPSSLESVLQKPSRPPLPILQHSHHSISLHTQSQVLNSSTSSIAVDSQQQSSLTHSHCQQQTDLKATSGGSQYKTSSRFSASVTSHPQQNVSSPQITVTGSNMLLSSNSPLKQTPPTKTTTKSKERSSDHHSSDSGCYSDDPEVLITNVIPPRKKYQRTEKSHMLSVSQATGSYPKKSTLDPNTFRNENIISKQALRADSALSSQETITEISVASVDQAAIALDESAIPKIDDTDIKAAVYSSGSSVREDNTTDITAASTAVLSPQSKDQTTDEASRESIRQEIGNFAGFSAPEKHGSYDDDVIALSKVDENLEILYESDKARGRILSKPKASSGKITISETNNISHCNKKGKLSNDESSDIYMPGKGFVDSLENVQEGICSNYVSELALSEQDTSLRSNGSADVAISSKTLSDAKENLCTKSTESKFSQFGTVSQLNKKASTGSEDKVMDKNTTSASALEINSIQYIRDALKELKIFIDVYGIKGELDMEIVPESSDSGNSDASVFDNSAKQGTKTTSKEVVPLDTQFIENATSICQTEKGARSEKEQQEDYVCNDVSFTSSLKFADVTNQKPITDEDTFHMKENVSKQVCQWQEEGQLPENCTVYVGKQDTGASEITCMNTSANHDRIQPQNEGVDAPTSDLNSQIEKTGEQLITANEVEVEELSNSIEKDVSSLEVVSNEGDVFSITELSNETVITDKPGGAKQQCDNQTLSKETDRDIKENISERLVTTRPSKQQSDNLYAIVDTFIDNCMRQQVDNIFGVLSSSKDAASTTDDNTRKPSVEKQIHEKHSPETEDCSKSNTNCSLNEAQLKLLSDTGEEQKKAQSISNIGLQQNAAKFCVPSLIEKGQRVSDKLQDTFKKNENSNRNVEHDGRATNSKINKKHKIRSDQDASRMDKSGKANCKDVDLFSHFMKECTEAKAKSCSARRESELQKLQQKNSTGDKSLSISRKGTYTAVKCMTNHGITKRTSEDNIEKSAQDLTKVKDKLSEVEDRESCTKPFQIVVEKLDNNAKRNPKPRKRSGGHDKGIIIMPAAMNKEDRGPQKSDMDSLDSDDDNESFEQFLSNMKSERKDVPSRTAPKPSIVSNLKEYKNNSDSQDSRMRKHESSLSDSNALLKLRNDLSINKNKNAENVIDHSVSNVEKQQRIPRHEQLKLGSKILHAKKVRRMKQIQKKTKELKAKSKSNAMVDNIGISIKDSKNNDPRIITSKGNPTGAKANQNTFTNKQELSKSEPPRHFIKQHSFYHVDEDSLTSNNPLKTSTAKCYLKHEKKRKTIIEKEEDYSKITLDETASVKQPEKLENSNLMRERIQQNKELPKKYCDAKSGIADDNSCERSCHVAIKTDKNALPVTCKSHGNCEDTKTVANTHQNIAAAVIKGGKQISSEAEELSLNKDIPANAKEQTTNKDNLEASETIKHDTKRGETRKVKAKKASSPKEKVIRKNLNSLSEKLQCSSIELSLKAYIDKMNKLAVSRSPTDSNSCNELSLDTFKAEDNTPSDTQDTSNNNTQKNPISEKLPNSSEENGRFPNITVKVQIDKSILKDSREKKEPINLGNESSHGRAEKISTLKDSEKITEPNLSYSTSNVLKRKKKVDENDASSAVAPKLQRNTRSDVIPVDKLTKVSKSSMAKTENETASLMSNFVDEKAAAVAIQVKSDLTVAAKHSTSDSEERKRKELQRSAHLGASKVSSLEKKLKTEKVQSEIEDAKSQCTEKNHDKRNTVNSYDSNCSVTEKQQKALRQADKKRSSSKKLPEKTEDRHSQSMKIRTSKAQHRDKKNKEKHFTENKSSNSAERKNDQNSRPTAQLKSISLTKQNKVTHSIRTESFRNKDLKKKEKEIPEQKQKLSNFVSSESSSSNLPISQEPNNYKLSQSKTLSGVKREKSTVSPKNNHKDKEENDTSSRERLSSGSTRLEKGSNRNSASSKAASDVKDNKEKLVRAIPAERQHLNGKEGELIVQKQKCSVLSQHRTPDNQKLSSPDHIAVQSVKVKASKDLHHDQCDEKVISCKTPSSNFLELGTVANEKNIMQQEHSTMRTDRTAQSKSRKSSQVESSNKAQQQRAVFKKSSSNLMKIGEMNIARPSSLPVSAAMNHKNIQSTDRHIHDSKCSSMVDPETIMSNEKSLKLINPEIRNKHKPTLTKRHYDIEECKASQSTTEKSLQDLDRHKKEEEQLDRENPLLDLTKSNKAASTETELFATQDSIRANEEMDEYRDFLLEKEEHVHVHHEKRLGKYQEMQKATSSVGGFCLSNKSDVANANDVSSSKTVKIPFLEHISDSSETLDKHCKEEETKNLKVVLNLSVTENMTERDTGVTDSTDIAVSINDTSTCVVVNEERPNEDMLHKVKETPFKKSDFKEEKTDRSTRNKNKESTPSCSPKTCNPETYSRKTCLKVGENPPKEVPPFSQSDIPLKDPKLAFGQVDFKYVDEQNETSSERLETANQECDPKTTSLKRVISKNSKAFSKDVDKEKKCRLDRADRNLKDDDGKHTSVENDTRRKRKRRKRSRSSNSNRPSFKRAKQDLEDQEFHYHRRAIDDGPYDHDRYEDCRNTDRPSSRVWSLQERYNKNRCTDNYRTTTSHRSRTGTHSNHRYFDREHHQRYGEKMNDLRMKIREREHHMSSRRNERSSRSRSKDRTRHRNSGQLPSDKKADEKISRVSSYVLSSGDLSKKGKHKSPSSRLRNTKRMETFLFNKNNNALSPEKPQSIPLVAERTLPPEGEDQDLMDEIYPGLGQTDEGTYPGYQENFFSYQELHKKNCFYQQETGQLQQTPYSTQQTPYSVQPDLCQSHQVDYSVNHPPNHLVQQEFYQASQAQYPVDQSSAYSVQQGLHPVYEPRYYAHQQKQALRQPMPVLNIRPAADPMRVMQPLISAQTHLFSPTLPTPPGCSPLQLQPPTLQYHHYH